MNSFPFEEKKPLSLWLKIFGALCLSGGIFMVFTNPSPSQYHKFASDQLVEYAKNNVCPAKSSNLEEALKSQMCHLMVETGKSQVPKLIEPNTKRYNYLLLSLYETNLYIYQFQTIGFFNNFLVVNAEKLYD